MARSFSRDRLFKLIKTTSKVAWFLSIAIFAISIYQYFVQFPIVSHNYFVMCSEMFDKVDPTVNTARLRLDCFNSSRDFESFWLSIMLYSGIFIIPVPISIFVISKTANYVFPKAEELPKVWKLRSLVIKNWIDFANTNIVVCAALK